MQDCLCLGRCFGVISLKTMSWKYFRSLKRSLLKVGNIAVSWRAVILVVVITVYCIPSLHRRNNWLSLYLFRDVKFVIILNLNLGDGLTNVKLKWLCFPSSHITEQYLICYVEKLQLEFILIPIFPFPFPYFYSNSPSYYHDTVIVTPIPVVIPSDPNCSNSDAHL